MDGRRSGSDTLLTRIAFRKMTAQLSPVLCLAFLRAVSDIQ
jgi:hypothetical protein